MRGSSQRRSVSGIAHDVAAVEEIGSSLHPRHHLLHAGNLGTLLIGRHAFSCNNSKYQLRDPNKREIGTLAHRAASEALTVCKPQDADGRLGTHVT